MKKNSVVQLFGVPGSGKSSVAERLSMAYNRPCFPEPFESNPLIARCLAGEPVFYECQTVMLDLVEDQEERARRQLGVIDGGILQTMAFCKYFAELGLLTPTELSRLHTYGWYRLWMQEDVPVQRFYISVTPETMLERIQLRGRQMEANTTLEQCQKQVACFDKFFNYSCEDVVLVDGNKPIHEVVAAILKY